MANVSLDAPAQGTPRLNPARVLSGRRDELLIRSVPYVVLVLLFVWLGILQPASLGINQLHTILNLTLPLIFIAVGQTIVVLTGGLDLSVGGVVSVVSVLTALTMKTSTDVVLFSILLIALSVIPGLFNGVLIVYGRIQPFVVTLATWFILSGIALILLPTPGGTIDPLMGWLYNGRVVIIPISVVLFVVLMMFGAWFQRTRTGLEIQAIGSDREAAFHSGIRIKRMEILAYVLCSFFAVLGGLVLASQSLSGDPRVGDSYILPSFAAVAIGGARLSGGSGSIIGSMFGALALTYLTSVTYALGLRSEWALIFQAVLLIASVAFQYIARVFLRK